MAAEPDLSQPREAFGDAGWKHRLAAAGGCLGLGFLTSFLLFVAFASEGDGLEGFLGCGGITVLLIGISQVLPIWKRGKCPACGKAVEQDDMIAFPAQELGLLGPDRAYECHHCHELLREDRRARQIAVLSLRPGETGKDFEAPMGRFPPGCVACGAAVAHKEPLDASHYDPTAAVARTAGKLIGGGLLGAVAQGLAEGFGGPSKIAVDAEVPYCASHSGLVGLKLRDKKPRLVFAQLDARRRYLTFNQTHVHIPDQIETEDA